MHGKYSELATLVSLLKRGLWTLELGACAPAPNFAHATIYMSAGQHSLVLSMTVQSFNDHSRISLIIVLRISLTFCKCVYLVS